MNLELNLELLNKVETIARAAGELALSFQGSTEVEYKDGFAESPVTAGDYAVDAYLKEHLTALNPAWGWLSEETADDGAWQQRDYFWVVDPIDGTTGYVWYLKEGVSDVADKNIRRTFAVSIALVEKATGKSMLGVIYTPLDQSMVAAIPTQLFLNGSAYQNPESPQMLADCTFLASTSEMRRGLIDFLVPYLPLKTMGSSANKLAQVATNTNMITASVKPKCWWDVAAAACILEARGFKLTDLAGNPIRFIGTPTNIDGVIAAPVELFDNLFILLPRQTLAGDQ